MSRVVVALGVLLLLALTGCDDDAARAELTERRAVLDALADELATTLPASLGAGLRSGSTAWASCTQGQGKDARAVGHLQYDAPPRASLRAVASAASALRRAGWTQVVGAGDLVEARRDGVTLRLLVGAHAVDVELRTACVAAPRDLARELVGRPSRSLP